MNHDPGFHLSCDEHLSKGWGPPLAYDGDPLTYRRRRIVRTWESEAAAAPSVDILTAAFVRLVYPLWGASTTATIVRKARSRP